MPTCDEDDCTTNATATCTVCAALWCNDHSGGAEADCPQCAHPLEAL